LDGEGRGGSRGRCTGFPCGGRRHSTHRKGVGRCRPHAARNAADCDAFAAI